MKVIKNSINKFQTLQKVASKNLITKGSNSKKKSFKHVTLQNDSTLEIKGGIVVGDMQGL